MSKYGVLEARNMFSALVDRAANGEEVTITKHGKPVARLVPPGNEEKRSERAREAVAWIRANRKKNALNGLSIKDLIEEGRRF